MKFSALLLGLGNIGQGYDYNQSSDSYVTSHAQALANDERYTLASGIDPDPMKREKFHSKFGIPAYPSIHDIPEHQSFDLIVVATPTSKHSSSIREVLKRFKPKAILCEKPIANNLKEAEAIVRLCQASQIPIYVNFIRRCDPAIIKFKEMLANDEVCKPFRAICWYSFGLLNSASHFCDLMQFWFGDPLSFNFIGKRDKFSGDGDIEADFILTFDQGDVLFRYLPNVNMFYNNFEVFFYNGRLTSELNGDLTWKRSTRHLSASKRYSLSQDHQIFESEMKVYQKNVYNSLFTALCGTDIMLTQGNEYLVCAKIFERIVSRSENDW